MPPKKRDTTPDRASPAAVPTPVTVASIRSAAAPKLPAGASSETCRAALGRIATVRTTLTERLPQIAVEEREADDARLDVLVHERNACRWGLDRLVEWEEETREALAAAEAREQAAVDDAIVVSMRADVDELATLFQEEAKAREQLADVRGRARRVLDRWSARREQLHDVERADDVNALTAVDSRAYGQFMMAIGAPGYGAGDTIEDLEGRVLFDARRRPYGPNDADWRAAREQERAAEASIPTPAPATTPYVEPLSEVRPYRPVGLVSEVSIR